MVNTATMVPGQHTPGDELRKRDFLKLVAGATAAAGAGWAAYALLDTMAPASDVLALSSVDVDLSPVPAGSGITVVWRGKPIFIRHMTPDEIQTAKATPMRDLIEPVPDSARVKAGHEQWAIMVGICTHLGCVPLGNKPTDPRGDYGGYFCPCHGSQYDVVGRVRHGPAPANLALPPYAFESDTKIKIG